MVLITIGACAQSTGRDLYGEPCYFAAADFSVNFGCPNARNASCLCRSTQFLQTFVNCVDNWAPKKMQMRAYQYGAYTCKHAVTLEQLSSYSTGDNDNSIPWQNLNPKAVVGGPICVPDAKVNKNIRARALRLHNYWASRLYGSGLLGFIALLLLFKSAFWILFRCWPSFWFKYLNNRLARWIQKKIVIPSVDYTAPSRSGKPLTRFHVLVISVYVFLNIVLLAVDHRIVLPNYKYSTKHRQLEKYLADRSGILALSQIPLLFLFGGRNNFLISVTGWNIGVFNLYHKWIGRTVITEVVIHSICYVLGAFSDGNYSRVSRQWVWIWGSLGTVACSLIAIQSISALRRRAYEIFLISHIALSVIFTIAAWNHLKHFAIYKTYLLASIAIWSFDRLVRLARIAWSLSCRGSNKVGAYLKAEDIIEIRIPGNKISYYPGCYAFVYFLMGMSSWQSHPFTVLNSQTQDGTLILLVKVHRGITQKVKRCLVDASQKRCGLSIPVLIEGGYGHCAPLDKYRRTVLIAGGIGITAILPYSHMLRSKHNLERKVTLIWIVKNKACLSWVSLDHIDNTNVTIQIYVTRSELCEQSLTDSAETSSCESHDRAEIASESKIEPLHSQDRLGGSSSQNSSQCDYSCTYYYRPDISDILHTHIREADRNQSELAIVTCGPKMLNSNVRKAIAKSSSMFQVDYYEESLGW